MCVVYGDEKEDFKCFYRMFLNNHYATCNSKEVSFPEKNGTQGQYT